jgi:hypothetical protein
MTQSRSVCSRIRNVRASLDNAERSFRSNQEVRGELDLMLAEAELDNLRQKRPGISWTRHTLAACFAVLVLASGCLGWWWASAYGGNTTNAAGLQEASAIAVQKELTAGADKETAVPRQDIMPSATVSEKKAAIKKKSEAPPHTAVAVPKQQPTGNREGSVRLSAGQMRQLIRSGRQELENVR